MVTLDDVRAASEQLRPYVVRTPLERSIGLSAVCGLDVWLKLECFQRSGSFKLRGALNALLLLDEQARKGGVVTASAGNHGLGVAMAAKLLGIRATVVVPETASTAKVESLSHSGAELLQRGATYDDAEAAGIGLARERGLRFVSAYNDESVIAGAGTVALEIFEDLAETRTLVVPSGGGGLISGMAVAAHGINPDVSVIGVQSVVSAALHAALAAGRRVTVDVGSSLADGLAGNIEVDSITIDLAVRHVRDVALVEEAHIAWAMRWLLEHEHVLVEGSAAVGVAALQFNRPRLEGPVVVVLTGRNVATTVLQQYVLG